MSAGRGSALLIAAVTLVVAASAAALAIRSPQPTARPPVASCSGTFDIVADGATLAFPYCANRSITTRDDGINRLVVVIHGDARNPDEYVASVQAAADAADAVDALIIAPYFRTSDDAAAGTTPAGLYFTDNGWKEGDPSETKPFPRPASLGSFEALDDLIRAVLTGGAFPNVRTVVITGHSAGGQFVDRYAATSPLEDELGGSFRFRYVIANPSSYLYFDARRPQHAGNAFEEPSARDRRGCPDFDTWKYGLEGRNAYAASASPATILARYARRDIVYLLGGEDTNTHDASLDTSCAAEWQGHDRLERGRRHFAYLGTVFGEAVYGSHVLVVIDGVGHDGPAMYLADAARAAVFGGTG